MVKRGISFKSEFEEDEKLSNYSFIRDTLSKTASVLGVGALGLSVFKYNEFPLHFYAISLGFSFFIHAASLYLISQVTKGSNFGTVIGSSIFCGSGCTYFSVCMISAALIIISGISFSLAVRYAGNTIDLLAKNVSIVIISLILGILFFSIIMFVKNRKFLYPWSKISLAILVLTLNLFKLVYEWDLILQRTSENIKLSFEISFYVFREFLTVVGISLFSLFSKNINDQSILKKRDNYHKVDSDTKSLLSNLLSSSIGFVCYNLMLASLLGKPVTSLFTECVFSNVIFRGLLGILLTTAILVQSFEFFDSAHNLFYDFFKPLTHDSIQSLDNTYIRDFILISVMFSIAYFVYDSDDLSKSFYNGMNCVFCLALSISFLVMPAYAMIIKYRTTSDGIYLSNYIICALVGITGMILFISASFGLSSIQNQKLFQLMIENLKFCFISCITSVLIYLFGLILDVVFYPPKPSPINHRTINSYNLPNYGISYVSEILILICFVASYSSPIKDLLKLKSDNFFGDSGLFIVQCILRILIHGEKLHLLINCIFLYHFGKKISAEIGPFHFLSFFLVSGLLSGILDSVLMAHTRLSKFPMSIGISGINFALISRYIFREGSIITFKLIPVTGYEFLILSILFDVFFHLTGLLDSIAHSAHLSGLLFGLFFWKY